MQGQKVDYLITWMLILKMMITLWLLLLGVVGLQVKILLNLDNDPSKKGSNEQTNGKIKCLEKSNDGV